MTSKILENIILRHIEVYQLEFMTKKVKEFLNEEILHTIPCLGSGSDAAVLKSIVSVSKNFLCEYEITGTNDRLNYDAIRINSICNIRVSETTQEIMVQDVVAATFYLASVELKHLRSLTTGLSFTGTKSEREEWLSEVRKIFTPQMLVT